MIENDVNEFCGGGLFASPIETYVLARIISFWGYRFEELFTEIGFPQIGLVGVERLHGRDWLYDVVKPN